MKRRWTLGTRGDRRSAAVTGRPGVGQGARGGKGRSTALQGNESCNANH